MHDVRIEVKEPVVLRADEKQRTSRSTAQHPGALRQTEDANERGDVARVHVAFQAEHERHQDQRRRPLAIRGTRRRAERRAGKIETRARIRIRIVRRFVSSRASTPPLPDRRRRGLAPRHRGRESNDGFSVDGRRAASERAALPRDDERRESARSASVRQRRQRQRRLAGTQPPTGNHASFAAPPGDDGVRAEGTQRGRWIVAEPTQQRRVRGGVGDGDATTPTPRLRRRARIGVARFVVVVVAVVPDVIFFDRSPTPRAAEEMRGERVGEQHLSAAHGASPPRVRAVRRPFERDEVSAVGDPRARPEIVREATKAFVRRQKRRRSASRGGRVDGGVDVVAAETTAEGGADRLQAGSGDGVVEGRVVGAGGG